MSNNINNISNCSGCGLCESICPQNAISLKEDDHHFLYPNINDEKCVNCGLCFKKCPQNATPPVLNRCSFLYINEDKLDLYHSASGGAFSKLARCIIGEGGVVYGAAWTEKLQVKHVRIATCEDVIRIQKSKYIQSRIEPVIYKTIKKDVGTGRIVLFSGTPCQCAAVFSLFDKKPNNLFLVDIVCHGVPNQWAFDQNIKAFERVYKGRVTGFSFRYKERFNSNNRRFSLLMECGNHNVEYTGSYVCFPYYNAFHSSLIFRQSCYACSFRDSNRYSDLTLGDFWGLARLDDTFSNGYDKSIVISNTKLGDTLIKKYYKNLKQYAFEKSLEYNKSYYHNSPKIDYSFYDKCESIQQLENDLVVSTKMSKNVFIKNCIKKVLNKIGFKYEISHIDFCSRKPAKVLNIDSMKKEVESIFKEVIHICNKYSITYYCQAGTVLGAIRHAGPIPWDYDVDIIVPNNQIDNLCELLDKELPSRYYVDYFKIGSSSKRQFPRVGLKGYSTEVLHLDIFRLIGLPNDKVKQIYLVKHFNKLTSYIVQSRQPNISLLRNRKYKIFLLNLLFGKRFFLKRFDKIAKKYDYDKSIYVMNPSGRYKEKNIFKKSVYGAGREVNYSNFKVIVPEETDFYLRQYYGDYLKIPTDEYISSVINILFIIR